MTTYFLGGEEFPTKVKIIERCREITANAEVGALLSGNQEQFVSDLFKRHPEWEEKAGTGIAGFSVQGDSLWRKSRHFVVHRTDGTSIDFSWKICVAGKLPPRKDDVFPAMRNEVAAQIIGFRNEQFAQTPEMVCPITGAIVTKETSHVDHAPPHSFRSLVGQWMEKEKLSFDEIELTRRNDGYGWDMGSAPQALLWKAFHDQNAHLRIVHALARHA